MKRRDLSAEERALWLLATRDVKPAKKRARRILRDAALQAAPQDEASRQSERKSFIQRSAPKARVPKDRAATAPIGAAKVKPPPAFAAGDPKADKKAARGLIPIEARLDLHGLTEAAAHARVTRFILGAHEDGLRLILVITGKGARQTPGTAGGEGRGIIRARFADWVEQAPLRAAIARVAPASRKDGGPGAFYVFLKRKTRG